MPDAVKDAVTSWKSTIAGLACIAGGVALLLVPAEPMTAAALSLFTVGAACLGYPFGRDVG